MGMVWQLYSMQTKLKLILSTFWSDIYENLHQQKFPLYSEAHALINNPSQWYCRREKFTQLEQWMTPNTAHQLAAMIGWRGFCTPVLNFEFMVS